MLDDEPGLAETSTSAPTSTSSDYLILFGDLVGSTEVAVEASPVFFARTYIASFHWAAYKALDCVKRIGSVFGKADFTRQIEQIEVAGDEVHVFFPIDAGLEKSASDYEDLVASAVSFAYITKLYWLAAPYNVQRMLGQQFPRDISVGIHIGRAAAVQNTVSSDVAGLHINMTKRIETQARDGKESRIFASRDITDRFERWRDRYTSTPVPQRPPLSFTKFFPWREPIAGKGVPKKFNVLELEQAEKKVDSREIINLVSPLATTPEKVDVPAESAVRIMAETFIPNDGPIFSGPDLSVDNIVEAQTAREYINKWFDAIHSLPEIFLDEQWLVFNCFFVSSALMRHPAVDPTQLERYRQTAVSLLLRLEELLKRAS